MLILPQELQNRYFEGPLNLLREVKTANQPFFLPHVHGQENKNVKFFGKSGRSSTEWCFFADEFYPFLLVCYSAVPGRCSCIQFTSLGGNQPRPRRSG